MKARSLRLHAGYRTLIVLVFAGTVLTLLLQGSVRAQPMLAQLGHWMRRPSTQDLVLPTAAELRDRADTRTVRALLQQAPALSMAQRDRLARQIVAWSRDNGFEPLQTMALIQIESNFNPVALSPVGAAGLLQLIPYVAQDLADRAGYRWIVTTRRVGLDVPFDELPEQGEVSLLNPEVSLRLGLMHLAELKRSFPSPVQYYAAYNLGPSLLRSRLEQGQPPQGIYYRKVLNAQRQFEQQRQWLIARDSGWQISRDHTRGDSSHSMVMDSPLTALLSR